MPRALQLSLVFVPLFLAACGGDDPSPPAPPGGAGSALRTGETAAPPGADAGFDLRDPRADGWDTEVLNEEAGAQLKALGKLIEHPGELTAAALAKLCAAPAEGRGLSAARASLRADATLQVDSLGAAESDDVPARDLHVELAELAALFEDVGEPHVKFKVIGVHLDGEQATTEMYVDVHAVGARRSRELHARWRATWSVSGAGPPRLARLVCLEPGRLVTTTTPAGTLFQDVTAAALADEPSFAAQLARGVDHWARQIETLHGLTLYGHAGCAVGDVDGDGREDLYVCQPAGLPNKLLLQRKDGTFRDVSAGAGVDWLDASSSAVLVDLDGDGDVDLAVATPGGLLLHEGDGRGGFTARGSVGLLDTDVYALSAIDYDLDARLDLYVTTDFASREARAERPRGSGFVYVDANDGGSNRLLRGEGDFAFRDVTEEVGLDVNNTRHSLAAAWADYDADGDPDLYVANDYGQNCLYVNEGGRFTDVAASAGVVDFGSGMSVSWGDANGDARLDLYVSNMFSSAGNRITNQGAFLPDVDDETRALYRRFAKGNTLFVQQADGSFEEATEAGVEMGRWAWGSTFLDLENDGRQDLVVGNGYITTEDSGDL